MAAATLFGVQAAAPTSSPWSYVVSSGTTPFKSANTATDLNGVSWTCNTDATSPYFGANWSSKNDTWSGLQFGKSKAAVLPLTLTTSDFSTFEVTQIKINACAGDGNAVSIAIKVGDSEFTSDGNTSIALTNSQSEYTFTGSGSGDVTISYTGTTTKAVYLRSLEITFKEKVSETAPAAPTITDVNSIIAGTYYFFAEELVKLSSDVAGAEIFYTLDGTDPNVTFTDGVAAAGNEATKKYTEELTLTDDADLVAVAVANGEVGQAAKRSYVRILPAVTPEAGTITVEDKITISLPIDMPAGKEAYICYTTDGTTPTTASELYTEPFTISKTGETTLKVIAFYEANENDGSKMAEVTYNVEATRTATPEITVAVEGIVPDQTATVTITAVEGAKVYYTTDGTEPTVESTLYTKPFTLTESATVNAIALAENHSESLVASEKVVVNDSYVRNGVFYFNERKEINGLAASKNTDYLSKDFTGANVTISASKCRYWETTNASELRLYNGGTLTITADTGYALESIEFDGETISLSKSETSEGTYSNKKWTAPTEGKVSSVEFTYSSTQNINTIAVVATSKIETGVAELETEAANAVYFTLQGVRVENPQQGLFIKVQNGKASKVLVK